MQELLPCTIKLLQCFITCQTEAFVYANPPSLKPSVDPRRRPGIQERGRPEETLKLLCNNVNPIPGFPLSLVCHKHCTENRGQHERRRWFMQFAKQTKIKQRPSAKAAKVDGICGQFGEIVRDHICLFCSIYCSSDEANMQRGSYGRTFLKPLLKINFSLQIMCLSVILSGVCQSPSVCLDL